MKRVDFKKHSVKETGEIAENKSLAKEKYKSAEGIVVKEFYTEEETKKLYKKKITISIPIRIDKVFILTKPNKINTATITITLLNN